MASSVYQCNVAFPSMQSCVGVWRMVSNTFISPVSMMGRMRGLSGCLAWGLDLPHVSVGWW